MRLHLIAVGTRMPAWVQAGYEEYARRLPPECRLVLTEIPLGHRGKGADPVQAQAQEGGRMLDAIPKRAQVVALDVRGQECSTEELAGRLRIWMNEGDDIALLVGGPDGLAPACLERAAWRWSLSRLTLPHALVRVLLAEQVYRAWTLLAGHPYHRA